MNLDLNLIEIGIIAGGLILGLIVGFILAGSRLNKSAKKEKANLIKEAEIKAEALKQEKILQAKEKFLQLKSEHDKSIQEKNNTISQTENRLKQKDNDLSKKIEDVNRKDKELEGQKSQALQQIDLYKQRNDEVEKIHRRQVEMLEKVSGMKADDAKAQLVESVKGEAKTQAMAYIKDIMDEAKLTANKEAKKIIIQSFHFVAFNMEYCN